VNEAIFVVNAGSSSIKFKLYRVIGRDVALLLGGALDGIGTRPRLQAKDEAGTVLVDRRFAPEEIASAPQGPARHQRMGAAASERCPS